MSENYSKVEIDLKFKNNEQKTQLMFQEILTEFQKVDKDINWLSKITLATFGLILSLLVGAAFKLLFFHS